MSILAFAASTSSTSINKMLVTYAASLIEKADVEVIDLRDFEMPLFSTDKEKELGQLDTAKRFLSKISQSNGLIVSFAEHNGSYAAAYKNIFDWASRIDPKVFQKKPMLLLATSPGKRGGASVLQTAKLQAPFFDGQVVGDLAVPSFNESFDRHALRLKDATLDAALKGLVSSFEQACLPS